MNDFTVSVGFMRIPNKTNSLVVVVLLAALVACTTRTIEGSNLTPENPECRASVYEGIVQQHASDLGTGRYRNLIVSTLSEMAVAVWRMEPSSIGTCQIRYQIGSKPGQPIYDIAFQSNVTFFVEPSRVCLNQTDTDGPDRNGIRVPDAEIEHPWRWIDQGPSVDGLPDGYFARREYVPVCFNRNGEIEGYLDG